MQLATEYMNKPPVPMKPSTTLEPQKRVIMKLDRAINALREHDAEMQAQTISILLQVAVNPGIAMRALEERTGLRSSSVSRNVTALSDLHRSGKPGLGMVVAKEDPDDRRSKQVFLTTKGNRVVERLLEILKDLGDAK